MGQARLRKIKAAEDKRFSKALTRARFDLYTLGTRKSLARLMAQELSWWADKEETILGLVFRDTTDGDYGWNLIARDESGRFRWVDGDVSISSIPRAEEALWSRMAKAIANEDVHELGKQHDRSNVPFDLLAVHFGADHEKLHPYFKALLNESGREPARAAIKEIGPWLAPSDPHFVRQFQFDQFDQRLWEIYIWAAMRELGFDIVQGEAPDFQCSAPGIAFTIEATTASISTDGPMAVHPDPKTAAEMAAFLKDYMPIKFGSCLTSKLNKTDKDGRHYWEREESKGKPFILAVADFHKAASVENGTAASLTYTQSALWPYLYGHRISWEKLNGELLVKASPNPEHVYGTKKIPSGFFDLPKSENVSAVLFSNAGTIAKFDRMGVVAGFRATGHHYLRFGFRYNPDPNATEPIFFAEDVTSPEYEEFWSDELQVFHNPNAKIPLPREWFSDLIQHWFEDGKQSSIIPSGRVLGSLTGIFVPKRGRVPQ